MVTSVMIAIAILGSAIYPAEVQTLAPIIEGEGRACPTKAMLDIASVYQNNDKMNGWQKPSKRALAMAYKAQYQTTLHNLGGFVFGQADIDSGKVDGIISGRRLLKKYNCSGGSLYIYAK